MRAGLLQRTRVTADAERRSRGHRLLGQLVPACALADAGAQLPAPGLRALLDRGEQPLDALVDDAAPVEALELAGVAVHALEHHRRRPPPAPVGGQQARDVVDID